MFLNINNVDTYNNIQNESTVHRQRLSSDVTYNKLLGFIAVTKNIDYWLR